MQQFNMLLNRNAVINLLILLFANLNFAHLTANPSTHQVSTTPVNGANPVTNVDENGIKHEYVSAQTPKEKRKDFRKTLNIALREIALGAVPLVALFAGKQYLGVDPLDPNIWAFAGISAIALRSYVFQTIKAIRANLYLKVKYPKILKAARNVAFEDQDQHIMVIPSFNERRINTVPIYENIASQAKDLSKPLILGISALDAVDFKKVYKDVPESEWDLTNEHEFIERTIKAKEPLTISVKIDPDTPDPIDVRYIQDINDIATTVDPKERKRKIEEFGQTLSGKRLKKQLDIAENQPLILPKIIIFWHDQGDKPKEGEEWKGDFKRFGMGAILRILQHFTFHDDAILDLMDGDTLLTPGLLKLVAQIMKVTGWHALTTDESIKLTDKPAKGLKRLSQLAFVRWMKQHLRRRHEQLASQTLGEMLTVLTGRYSAIRWKVGKSEEFAQALQTDKAWSAFWGYILYLSGDDKTTLAMLLKHLKETGELPARLGYIPNALAISLENIIKKGAFAHFLTNNQRWDGNMYRNWGRLKDLGSKVTRPWVQFELWEQGINPFTGALVPVLAASSLVGSIFFGHPISYFTSVIKWVTFSTGVQILRLNRHANKDIKIKIKDIFYEIPLLAISRSINAFIKILTMPALGDQVWAAHGQRRISAKDKGELRRKRFGMHAGRFVLISTLIAVSQVVQANIRPGQFWDFIKNPLASPEVALTMQDTKVIEVDSSWSAERINEEIQKFNPKSKESKLTFWVKGNIELDREIYIDKPGINIVGDSAISSKLVVKGDFSAIIANNASNMILSDIAILTPNSEFAAVDAFDTSMVFSQVSLGSGIQLSGASRLEYFDSNIPEIDQGADSVVIDLMDAIRENTRQ